MNLLFLLRPKGLGGWLFLLGLGSVAWANSTPDRSALKMGLVLGGFAAFLMVLGFALPTKFISFVAHLRTRIRMPVFSILAYCLMVTVCNFSELYSFRLWIAFLIPSGDSPFNHTHVLGLVAAAYLICTQDFQLPPNRPTDFEKVMPDEPFLIDQQQAQEQANDKLKS